MKILVACEESQAVCIALRNLGHEAYSCDILPCSGGKPEWHIQQDVLIVINREHWDMMIAFPPCTDLAVSGAAWFKDKIADGRQQASVNFFMQIVNAPIHKIAIENPVGIMSKIYKKPTQIIQPYFFGDEFQKTTCLWLKNLKPLYHNSSINLFDNNITHVYKGDMIEYASGNRMPEWYAKAYRLPKQERAKLRSKTFPGIAKAMAEQWGGINK